MDVRAHILKVATRRFARRGYDGTSLQAIADEVGVRKPSLLYHFPSKDRLRQGVVDHVLGHWQEVLPTILATKLDGETRFEALVRTLLEFFREDPDRARLVIRELMDRPREMREQLTVHVRPWVVMVSDLVHLGQESGEVRDDVDAEAYVVEVLVMVLTTVAASPILSLLVPPSPAVGSTDRTQAALDGRHHLDGSDDHDDRADRQLREMLRMARASLFIADASPIPRRDDHSLPTEGADAPGRPPKAH